MKLLSGLIHRLVPTIASAVACLPLMAAPSFASASVLQPLSAANKMLFLPLAATNPVFVDYGSPTDPNPNRDHRGSSSGKGNDWMMLMLGVSVMIGAISLIVYSQPNPK